METVVLPRTEQSRSLGHAVVRDYPLEKVLCATSHKFAL